MFPLVAIATSLLPDLIKLIAGDKAGTLTTDVANAVKQATGTTDPAAAKQKITTDPAIAANLQIQLAQIALAASKAQYDEQNQQRQAELDDLKNRLADVQSSRVSLLDLAKTQSPIAWVAPSVSFLVMVGFYVLLIILIRSYADDDKLSQNQLINISIGALVAAFSTVVNFWLGSSKSSQDKDRTQAAQTAEVLKTQQQQTTSALSTATAVTEKAAAANARAGSAAGTGPGAVDTSVSTKTDASTNFSQCLAVVLAEEGGYTNDPDDRGGPTNFGITIDDLREWRGTDVTAEDVKNMTKAEAQEIYRSKYWNLWAAGLAFSLLSSLSSAFYRVYFRLLLVRGMMKSAVIFFRLFGLTVALGGILLVRPDLFRSDLLLKTSILGLVGFTVPLFLSLTIIQRLTLRSFAILLFALPAITFFLSASMGYAQLFPSDVAAGALAIIGIVLHERRIPRDGS
jgi:Glycosyl hydrolase 108